MHFFAQNNGRWQHTTGKDIFLNEIDRIAVNLPTAMLNCNDLQSRLFARFQAISQRFEIDGPIFLANRLEHLNRGDPIIKPRFIAVILHLDLDLIRQARAGNPINRVIMLLARDG